MESKKRMLGIHIAAFLVGRVAVGSMYPFLVAFFLAAYLEGISSAWMFAVLLLGVASTLQFVSVIKYSVVIVLLMALLACVQDKYLSENRAFTGCIGGVVTFFAGVIELLIQGVLTITPYLPFFEAFLVACGTIVYQMAFTSIRKKPWNLLERNEAVISVLALVVTILAGLPVTAFGQFSILAAVCFWLVFYGGFSYGITAGATLGTICGILMALKTGQIETMACMALSGLTVGVARELGKFGAMAGAVVAYIFLGCFYNTSLLEAPMTRAFASAILIFALTPKGLLYRQAYPPDAVSMDMSIQKNVLEEFGQQLKEYGLAFGQLSENFMSYNAAPEQEVMLRQMASVGDMISDYAEHLQVDASLSKQQENQLKTAFWDKNILLVRMSACRSANGRQRIYLYVSKAKGRVATARELSMVVSRVLKKRFIVDDGSRSIVGHEESMIILVEAPNFTYQSGYICHRKRGESVCGDYSYMAPVNRQSILLMISDGMGSGEPAFRQSEFLTESIADLIGAGFDKDCSIGLVNAMMSLKYQGENFATLDLCSVDLYSGMAEFVKYGAAVTFIKRDRWIDTIMSTSLPLGAVPDAKADVSVKKLFDEDIIFMCSDGLMDCIEEEDKVSCMKEYLCELESDTPEDMAAELYRKIMQRKPENERTLKDDATLVVFRLKEAA